MFNSPILLIDDEPVMRDLYRRLLKGRGYNVVAVASGADALDVIHADLPELVLSDILMPGMTGHELCAKLVRAGEKRMPYVFLTANDDYQTVRAGLEAGGDDFLVKGMDFALIEERVRFWLKTPFDSLPQGPRAAAIEVCDALGADPDSAHEKPIKGLGRMREDLRHDAVSLVRRELEHSSRDLLTEEEVPLSFLGFVAGILDTLTAGDLPSLMRFPDYFDSILSELSPAWAAKARPLLADFEVVAENDLFRTARHKGQAEAGRKRT